VTAARSGRVVMVAAVQADTQLFKEESSEDEEEAAAAAAARKANKKEKPVYLKVKTDERRFLPRPPFVI
jgi:hypothetical protein